MTSRMRGVGYDKFKIIFDTILLKNQDGAELATPEIEGSLRKISLTPPGVKELGESLDSVVGGTLVTMLGFNVALGSSNEMLWGFINTLQIMYFWPVLNLDYPDHLSDLLISFSAAKLQVAPPFLKDAKDSVMIKYSLDMPAVNEKYEMINYESTSIFVNGIDFLTLMFQGFISCILIFAFKAMLITLHKAEISKNPFRRFMREQEEEDEERKQIKETRREKLKAWVKKKLQELSVEYKYGFFIRILLEMYLEIVVLSLLNIRYPKLENRPQWYSLFFAIFLVSILVIFFIWSFIHTWEEL